MRPNIPPVIQKCYPVIQTQLSEMYPINFLMVQNRYQFVASVTISDIKHTKAVSWNKLYYYINRQN